MSRDDSLSAGQLRQRYKAMPDDQMSASQLRARNAIPGNKFQRKDGNSSGSFAMLGGAGAVVLLIIVAYITVFQGRVQ